MDVKIVVLNGDLENGVYMDQPVGFLVEEKKHMVCKLNKLLYGLKEASNQCYNLKFNNTVMSFEFKESNVDMCMYLKVSESKIIFLIFFMLMIFYLQLIN